MLRLLVLLAALLNLHPASAQFLPYDPNIAKYPLLVPAARSTENHPLLFSDSPETPKSQGVLYRDTVTGKARVLAYHANGLGRPARLVVLARNTGGAGGTYTTLRRGSAVTSGPDPVIGQRTLLRFFASAPLPGRTVPAGETSVVWNSGVLRPNAVASVTLDLRTDVPLEVSVVMIAEHTPVHAALSLPVLPMDGRHQRGTFPGAVRALRVDVTTLPARLVLGGGADVALRGTDVLTGSPQVLPGNFGVLYDLEVAGAAGSVLAFSPRGGAYRGTLVVHDGTRTSLLLAGEGRALKDAAAPQVLWHPRSNTIRLEFVPANGSNMTVALVFYPWR